MTPCVRPDGPETCSVTRNAWTAVLARLKRRLAPEDFRHWFAETSYASDSGDQITVWVPSEAIRRHILGHYQDVIDDALTAIDRDSTHVRFVVTGIGDEDEDDEGD